MKYMYTIVRDVGEGYTQCSGTLGVFSSLEKAEEVIKDLPPCDAEDEVCYFIFKSTLDAKMLVTAAYTTIYQEEL